MKRKAEPTDQAVNMSNKGKSSRRTHHLKQSATAQLSLISMQVEELITGVQDYHRKIESETAQLLVGDDMEKLTALIAVLQKRLQIISSVNSSFYELLDSEDNEESLTSSRQEEDDEGQAESMLGPPASVEEQAQASAAQPTESQGAPQHLSQVQPAPLLPSLSSASTSSATGGGGHPSTLGQATLEQVVQLPVTETLWLGQTPAMANQPGFKPALANQLGLTPAPPSHPDLDPAISSHLFSQWNMLTSSRGSAVGQTLAPLTGYLGTNLSSLTPVSFLDQPDLTGMMPASVPEAVPTTPSSIDLSFASACSSLNRQLPQSVSMVAQPSFPAVDSSDPFPPSVMPGLFNPPGPPSLGTHCFPSGAIAPPKISSMFGALPDVPSSWLGPVSETLTSIGELPTVLGGGCQPGVTPGEPASPCSLGPSASTDETACRKILVEDTLSTDSTISVMVTFYNNPSDFYVVKDITTVERLANQISNHVEQRQEFELGTPFVGMVCLAKYSDGICYRARIVHIHNDDTLSVYFVDFGNTYRTLRSEILALSDQFCHLPALAIHCCLGGVMSCSKSGQWTKRAVQEFDRFVMGRPMVLKATVPPRPGSNLPYIVDLLCPTPVAIAAAGNGHEITNIHVATILLNLKEAVTVDNEELLAIISPKTHLEGSVSSGSTSYHTARSTSPSATSQSKHSRCDSCVEDVCDKIRMIHRPAEKIDDNGKKGHAVHQQPLEQDLRQFASTTNADCSIASEHPKLTPSLSKVSAFFVEPDTASSSACLATSGGTERQGTAADQKSDSADWRRAVPPSDSSNKHESSPVTTTVRRLSLTKEGRAQQQISQETRAEASAATRGNLSQMTSPKGERQQKQLHQVRKEPEEVLDEKSVFKTLMQSMDGGGDVSTFKAMVYTINSPSDFYVHLVSAETDLLNLEADLTRHFERMSDRDLRAYSKRLRAGPGVLCAAQFSKDVHYFRGLIVGTRKMQQLNQESDGAVHNNFEVHIFYIDYGEKEWLPRAQVYPLPNDFHCLAPQALWCSLAFVLPLKETSTQKQIGTSTSEGSSTVEWDERANAEFERMLRGRDNQRLLEIYAANYQPTQAKRAAEVQKCPLQIVVMIEEGGERICVNHDLIVRDFASFPISPAVSDHDDCRQEDGEDDPKKWLDMEHDAKSLRNTYAVDVGDAGVALTGVKARGGQLGICRFYNNPSGCWKGDKCHYLHGMEKNVSDNLKQVLAFDENQEEILPPEGSVVYVEVSCIINPQLFFVVLPWGPHSVQAVEKAAPEVESFLCQESLESLNKAMEEVYKNRRLDTDYSVFAIGQAVAAKCPESGAWFRAKVVDVNPDDVEICVMFVDFGDTMWVPETSVRLLDQRFLHLPWQAVECGLAGIAVPFGSKTWPKTSMSEFHSLVNGKTLLAHVQKRLGSGRLLLKLYDSSGDEDLDICTRLIAKGCAEASSDSCERSPQRPNVTQSPAHGANGVIVPA